MMLAFFETLKTRNEPLFYFGTICLLLSGLLLLLSWRSDLQVAGTNAWHKPLKFALSTWIFAWSMAWYTGYLGKSPQLTTYNWVIILTLGFEIAYIGIQASRGELSHYNRSSPLYAGLYTLMALAASLATLWTAYIALPFFHRDFPELPPHYLWAIRMGIILFVIFSFEGFVMGSRLSHTIGGADGGAGLPFLNWSKTFGDPRVAHFLGMHALQLLPLLSYYLLKHVQLTLLGAFLYALLAISVLIQAFQGKPFLRF